MTPIHAPRGTDRPALVVALLGAESTGKSTLARALREAVVEAGLLPAGRVGVVDEYLREFCVTLGRTPRIDEQAAIAAEQTRRIAASAALHPLVIADTTALMIAVYHEQVFGDRSLYPAAEDDHRRADLTLLTALDLPWVADPLRDGPGVRAPVDARIRAALGRIGRPYAVVHGAGRARTATALDALRRLWAARSPGDARADETARADARRPAELSPVCERCGDAACERHPLLPRV